MRFFGQDNLKIRPRGKFSPEIHFKCDKNMRDYDLSSLITLKYGEIIVYRIKDSKTGHMIDKNLGKRIQILSEEGPVSGRNFD
jgi:hypothetical protein